SRVTMQQPMPYAHVARIAALPSVSAVTGLNIVIGTYQRANNVQLVLGTDVDAMFQIYPEMTVTPAAIEAMHRTRTRVLVGKALADTQGYKIGDRIPIHSFTTSKPDGSSDWVFEVVGFYDMDPSDYAQNIIGNYNYINEARGPGKDQVVQMLVRIKDPS